MASNRIFRLYSDDPAAVFDWLDAHVRPAVVRRLGRKIGPSDWYYVTVVLDEAKAAKRFDAWLAVCGNRGRLDIGLPYPAGAETMSIEHAVWVSTRPNSEAVR